MVNLGMNLPGGAPDRGTPGPGRQLHWFDAIAASPRPAVVDYAAGGERVELSGRVLANWAAKTANLLDVEGHGPGSAVALDLPLGWKSLALLLGAARAGVDVVFAAGTAAELGSVDLVVSGAPDAWSGNPAELWAVAPGALEAPAEGLPAHALDYAAEVRMQADQCQLPLPGTGLPALVSTWTGRSAVRTADGGNADEDNTVPDAGASAPRLSHRERGLVVAAEDGRLDLAVARAALAMWDRGLPVVLVPARDAGVTGDIARVVEAERVGAPVEPNGQDHGGSVR